MPKIEFTLSAIQLEILTGVARMPIQYVRVRKEVIKENYWEHLNPQGRIILELLMEEIEPSHKSVTDAIRDAYNTFKDMAKKDKEALNERS